MSKRPLAAARWSGVLLFVFKHDGSHLCSSIKYFIMCRWPPSAALWRGVRPNLPWMFGLHFTSVMKNWTISKWPNAAAKCKGVVQFDLWPLKSGDQEPQKGTIKQLNTLFANQKMWSQSQTLQQATYKWLPLALADWIGGNDRHLALPSQMCMGDWLFYAGERVNPAKFGCHPHNAGELEGLTSPCPTHISLSHPPPRLTHLPLSHPHLPVPPTSTCLTLSTDAELVCMQRPSFLCSAQYDVQKCTKVFKGLLRLPLYGYSSPMQGLFFNCWVLHNKMALLAFPCLHVTLSYLWSTVGKPPSLYSNFSCSTIEVAIYSLPLYGKCNFWTIKVAIKAGGFPYCRPQI